MLSSLLLIIAVVQQPPTERLALERLLGLWSGQGTVNGTAVQATLNFETVLGKRFTRLTYRFQTGTAGTFEGLGYYAACDGAECTGRWFDSQGAVYALNGKQSADALMSEWGESAPARGRTEYRLTADDALTVTDWIRTPTGDWRQFGSVTYKRTK